MTEMELRSYILQELRDLQASIGALTREVSSTRAELTGISTIATRTERELRDHREEDRASFAKLHGADESSRNEALTLANTKLAQARERRYGLFVAILLALISAALGAGVTALMR